MIGSNRTIQTYRFLTASNKSTYATSTTLNGVPVLIQRESIETGAFIDEENAFDVYRMDSDRDLNIEENDKVVDNKGVTYTVHTVMKEDGEGYGKMTSCILKKQR